MMKIGVAGSTGRVGTLIVRELQSGNWPGLTLVGEGMRDAALFEQADVVIDFTTPRATADYIALARQTGKPLVVGTTGLSVDTEETLIDAARHAPVLRAANMSLGVNLLALLVEKAARGLAQDWDAEILETHHRKKIDAPSGTALMLGMAVRAGREGGDFIFNREGQRQTGDIGFAVRRGGDVVGEHEVTFYGMGEQLSLSHVSTDRSLYARGALTAARWLAGKPPGLYGMRDVLALAG